MRLLDWLLRRRRDDDLDAEIRAHLTLAERDLADGGLDGQAARLAARKTFGNVTLTREATRRAWGEAWRETVRDLLQDIRYAARVLRHSPGYSFVVVAVLTLGIGANASLFSVFKALALKPVQGVEDSGDLAVLGMRTTSGRISSLSHPDFRDIVAADRSFVRVAGATDVFLRLGTGATSQPASGEYVTGTYFEALGIRAQLGRTLLPGDDVSPGGHPVIVISDGLWRRAFGADPGIVGRPATINGQTMTIVGVAEPGFQGTVVSQVVGVFVPVMMQPLVTPPNRLDSRDQPLLWGIGKLRPSETIASAAAQADVLSARLTHLHSAEQAAERAVVIPIWQAPYGAQTYLLPALVPLGAMAVLLLLLVCANVSNLVLVRGVSRRGEVAVRLALGASRARIVRLLAVESLVLAAPAALLGLLVTRSLMLFLNDAATGNPDQPFSIDVSTDGYVVAFGLAIACGSALVFGLAPALRTSRLELASAMKDTLSPRSGSRGRLRSLLVVAQIAASFVLLVGAGLVVQSLDAARGADAGVDPANVALMDIQVQAAGYDEARGRVFFESLLDAVRSEPGVTAATIAWRLPLRMVEGPPSVMAVEGYVPGPAESIRSQINRIGSDYFRTLRIPLIAGREFTPHDLPASLPVAIVNETMARRFWGFPENAIGKRLKLDGGAWRAVVGVARDLKYFRLNEPPRTYVYTPFAQNYLPSLNLHVKLREDSTATLDQLRRRIQAMDANLSVPEAMGLAEYLRRQNGLYVIVAVVLATFGVIALLLAAFGTYGTVAYAARQSAHEIGIRLTVGANRADVVRRFVSSGMRLGAWGAAVGVVTALALTRMLGSLLYGVSATDAVSFAAASVAVLLIVLLASLGPAWRASRIDPIHALRHR